MACHCSPGTGITRRARTNVVGALSVVRKWFVNVTQCIFVVRHTFPIYSLAEHAKKFGVWYTMTIVSGPHN